MGNVSFEEVEGFVEEVADLHTPDVVLMESEALQEEKINAEESGKPYEAAPGVVLFKSSFILEHFFEFVDFGVKHPKEWEVLKLKLRNPDLTCTDIAKALSVSTKTAWRRLGNINSHMNHLGKQFKKKACLEAS